jgi:hypothetical protein
MMRAARHFVVCDSCCPGPSRKAHLSLCRRLCLCLSLCLGLGLSQEREGKGAAQQGCWTLSCVSQCPTAQHAMRCRSLLTAAHNRLQSNMQNKQSAARRKTLGV